MAHQLGNEEQSFSALKTQAGGTRDNGLWRFIYYRIIDDIVAIQFFCEQFLSSDRPVSERILRKMLFYNQDIAQTLDFISATSKDELAFQQFKESLPFDPIVRALFSHHLGNESYAIELIIATALDSVPPALSAGSADKIRLHCAQVREFMEHFRDVTYRQQPAGELLDSEKKLRALFESCRDAIIRFDLHGRVIDANPAASEMFGYAPGQLRQLKHRDLSAPRWHSVENMVMNTQVLARGASDILEEEFLRQDGSLVPVAVRMWLIRDDHGGPAGVWAFIRDITGTRKFEQTLLSQICELRQLFEKLGDGVTLSDTDGRYEIFNSKMAEISGFTFDEVRASGDLTGLIYPDPQDRQAALDGLAACDQNNGYRTAETTITCKDGSRKTLLVETSRVTYWERPMFLSIYHDISGRRKWEIELINSEDFYRAAFKKATVGMSVINSADGRYKMVNDAFCRMLGYSEEELLGKTFLDVTHEDDIGRSLQFKDLLESGKSSIRIEKRYRHKTGRTVWVDLSAELVHDYGPSGQEQVFVNHMIDITDRKEAELQLLESERKYRQIFNDCVIGLYRTTPEGRCLIANPTFAGYFDFDSSEEMITEVRDMADFYVRREDREAFKEKLFRDGQIRDYELLMKSRNGREFYLSVNGRTVYDDNGRPLYYEGTTYDITARKQAEAALVRAAGEWQTMFDASHDAIMLVDEESTVIRANAATERLLARPMEDIIGRKCHKLVHGTDVSPSLCPLVASRRTGLHEERELFDEKKGLWLLVSVSPVTTAYGHKRFVHTITDITFRKTAELSLKVEHDRARMYFDTAGVLFLALDPDAVIADINAFGSQMLGYMPQDLIGKNWITTCIPERMRDQIRYVFNTLKAGEEHLTTLFENPVLTRSGEERQVLWYNALIRDGEGRITGVLASGQDVTDRRKSETKVLRSKQRYDDLVGNLNVGIFRLASVEIGTLIDVNSAFMAIFGVSRKDDLILGNFWDLFEEQSLARRVRADLLSRSQVNNIEFRPAGAGEFRWCKLSAYVGVDENSKQIVDGIVEDITVFKSHEARLKSLVEEVQQSNKKLEQLSLTDYQTGLFNHRYFSKYIESEFDRSRRYAQPLGLMLIDIDFFKSINDVYGHTFGDAVLRQFAKQLRASVRQYDVVIRMGGEEFLVACPQSDRAATNLLAERIMETILKASFGTARTRIKLKISIGLCSYPQDMVGNAAMLVDIADKALSRAKEAGGCRILNSEEEAAGPQAAVQQESSVNLLLEKVNGLNKRALQSVTEAIYAFAKTIEVKDHYTGEHGEATVSFATGIARQLKMSREDVELIGQAAMIHDLGKIGVPEHILCKAGKLTKAEFEQIKRHPLIGASILQPIHFLHPLIPLILYHHERWDAKGYPHGLKGSEIPLKAQVIALADVFQALISDRPYRKSFSQDEAVRIIDEGSGTQFSPQVVEALKEYLAA